MRLRISLAIAVILFIPSCTSVRVNPLPQPDENVVPSIIPTFTSTKQEAPLSNSGFADVLSVKVSGDLGSYQFAVEISSPDTGCERYADWWEVIASDEILIYRRILLHSHVTEQPFTRTGGSVDIQPDMVVYIRAHMNKSGYGGQAMVGTVLDGFKPVELEASFASGLERIPPLPENCAF